MSRRSRVSDPLRDGTPPAPTPKAGEMTVSMKGDPDVVREKMNLNTEKGKAPEESSDQTEKVLSALANEGYQFMVKRILPREWQGQEARIVVYGDSCPMLYQDIINEVEATSGGRKYRLTVSDPSTGKPVAAKTFTIDADPILKKQESEDDPDMLKVLAGDPDADAMEAVGKSIQRQVKLAEQRVTLEQFQDTLDVLKRKREGKGAQGADDGTQAKLESMQRELEKERHARELERVQQQADQRIRDLESKVNSKPQGQTSELAAILDRMQKAQETSDRRFEQLMNQQREDKANEILRELRATRGAGGAGSFKEQMELFSMVAKTFGMRVPGSGDDDDEEADDDRPWYEKLGTQIADKFLPKLLDKFDSMEKEGKKVTKEDFMREIDSYAEKAADEAAQKEREKLARERGLPAAKPDAAPAQAAPAPVKELPPAAPGAAPAAPAASASPAAPAPAIPTLEQEISLNVNGVLILIQRELQTRRQFYQWNYEGAWHHLPEDVLEKVCTAPDCITMLDALKVPGLSAEGIEELKAKISANPKMVAWLKLGHDELVAWWKEKQQDPTFDPGAEDEEEDDQPVA